MDWQTGTDIYSLTWYDGWHINLPLQRHYFFLFTCLLAFTSSEINSGSGFNDKEQQICSLSGGDVGAAVFPRDEA